MEGMNESRAEGSARGEPGRVTDTPPCDHNLWLRLRVRYNLRYTRLECLECKSVWRARLGDFTKCSEFYAGGCSLGAKCPNPHVVSPAAAKFMKPGEPLPSLKEIKKLLKQERDAEKARAARERKQMARAAKAAAKAGKTAGSSTPNESDARDSPPAETTSSVPLLANDASPLPTVPEPPASPPCCSPGDESTCTSPEHLSAEEGQWCGLSSSSGSVTDAEGSQYGTKPQGVRWSAGYRHDPYSFSGFQMC